MGAAHTAQRVVGPPEMSGAILRARVLSKRWAHHSASGGYDRVQQWLGSEIEHIWLQGLSKRWIPERVAMRLVARAGVHNYSLDAFYLEWAAARDMLRARVPTVYHFLYADDMFRYLGAARKQSRHRVVATYHLPPRVLERDLSRTAHLARLDALIVVGRNQVPYFKRYLDEARIHFVPHGIDTTVFSPVAAVREPREPQCLFIGMHARDFAVLRKVIAAVSTALPEVRFVAITEESRRGLFEELPQVEFRSAVPESELLELYRRSALLVQPLEYATANNAILEGFGCALPVVATDLEGIRDYVDESCGVLTPRGNADEMTAACVRLLTNEAERRELAEGARRRAEELDWGRVAERIWAIYASLYEDGPPLGQIAETAG